jgi:uncharacterized protein
LEIDTMSEQRAFGNSVVWRDGIRNGADTASIVGHAAMFNGETVIDLGVFAFRERIMPGAFKRAIRHDDVHALFNHDPHYVLGRNKNKTLTLAEDSIGLRYEATPPKTQAADDMRQLLIGGYVSGSSFAFSEPADDWDDSEMKNGKLPLRTIRDFGKLLDVSPVTYPAYLSAYSSAWRNDARKGYRTQCAVSSGPQSHAAPHGGKPGVLALQAPRRTPLGGAWPPMRCMRPAQSATTAQRSGPISSRALSRAHLMPSLVDAMQRPRSHCGSGGSHYAADLLVLAGAVASSAGLRTNALPDAAAALA